MTAFADTERLATRAARAMRRTLDAVESTLRPTDDRPRDDHAPDDERTTREILVPRDTGERAANRARRQAEDYLARRRRKLRDHLDGR